jgi:hypothetical protein
VRDFPLEVREKERDVLFRGVAVAAVERRCAEQGTCVDERVGGAFEPADRSFGASCEKFDGAGRSEVPIRPLRVQAFDLLDERSRAIGLTIGSRARARAVAYAWDQPAHRGFYAFNDAHITMSLVAGGLLDDARRVVTELERAAGEDGSNAQMTRDVGLPLSHALVLFGEERYAHVVDILWPLRQTAVRFGGSNAQRDVIDQTLGVAAVRAGLPQVAAALAEERRLLRPGSSWARDLGGRRAA